MAKTPFRIPGTRLQPLLYFLAIACLYLDAFVFPCTPVYEGDTAPIYLLEATKMLQGQVIYRDFFNFTFPGTQVFYLLLFKLFGVRAWIPAAVWVGLGIALAWTCVVISKQILSGAAAYVPALIFLGVAYFSEPDPTHHWFSTWCCLAALAVLMPARSPWRWAAVGVLCGIATLFTHSRGIVAIAAFAAFLLWERHTRKLGWGWLFKTGMYLVIPFLASTLPVVAYLVWKVGLQRFIYCTVIFVLKYWSKWFWGTPYVYGADLPIDLPLGMAIGAMLMWTYIHLVLPFLYLLFYVQYRRRAKAHPEEPWDRLMLIAIVGFFMFLGIASSPVWFRLISVSPPVLILYGWLVKGPGKLPRFFTRLAWAGGLLALVVQPAIVQFGWKGYLDAPTGRAALLDPDHYEKYRWILTHTHPGDYYFQADDCDEYFLLGLRSPAEVSFVTDSIYTRPEQVRNVVAMLEKHQVHWVMWSAWLDVATSPGADGSVEHALRVYLHAHYHPVKEFEDQMEEAWERNGPAPAALNLTIAGQGRNSQMGP